MAGTGTATNDLVRLLTSGSLVGLSDGELLARFSRRRDEAAFSALVDRLGPMVLGTCRRRLSDPHDVDDAFQATFLILARRAHTLRDGDRLGAWLHGVARKVAARAHSRSIRLRSREQPNPAALAIAPDTRPDDARDLRDLIERELARLPAPYRHAFELCCLDGLTQSEAASLLRATPDQIRGRLERARILLRERLGKQGVRPASSSQAIDPATAERASVATSLMVSTVRLVLDQTPHTATALRLARETFLMLSLASMTKYAALMVAIGCTVSAGLLAQSVPMEKDPAKSLQKPVRSVEYVTPQVAESPGTAGGVGVLQALGSETIKNPWQKDATLLKIVPEGKSVKKGDIVAELDDAMIKRELTRLRDEKEEANHEINVAAHERGVEEHALREAHDRFQVQREVQKLKFFNARREQERAQALLAKAKQLTQKLEELFRAPGAHPSPNELVAQLEIDRRIVELENRIEELKASDQLMQIELKHMDAEEQYAMAKHGVQLEKLKHIERLKNKKAIQALTKVGIFEQETGSGKLKAPRDGIVIYAMPPKANGTNEADESLPEGVTLPGGAPFIEILDTSAGFSATVHVPEAIVDRIQPGQLVEVMVDAVPSVMYRGKVKSVAPAPDEARLRATGNKEYATVVRLETSSPVLRPGLTVRAKIDLTSTGKPLKVPTSAVVVLQEKPHVGIKNADTTIAWTPIQIDSWSDEYAIVRKGIRLDDRLVLDPMSALSEEEKAAKNAHHLPIGMQSVRRAGARTKSSTSPAQGVAVRTLREKLEQFDAQTRERIFKTNPPNSRWSLMISLGFTEEEIAELDSLRSLMRIP